MPVRANDTAVMTPRLATGLIRPALWTSLCRLFSDLLTNAVKSMPSIKLSDGFALSADVQLSPFSALLRYVKSLPSLIAGADLSRVGGLTLSDPAVTALKTGLSFSQPVEFGKGAPALTIQTGVKGSFSVISPSPGNDMLFSPDPFGDNIKIAAGTCYVAIELNASARADISGSAGALGFGIEPGLDVKIASYRNFPAGSDSPTLLEALRQSIGEFVIPADAEDIAAISPGSLVTVTTTWTLSVSGTVNLLAMANPLATAQLPAGIPAITVKAGESVQVGASYQISGEFQLRVQNMDSTHVRLGWYRRRSAEVKVTATASAGLSAGIGSTDLFPTILGAISSDAQADRDVLKQAGLSDGQVAGIQHAVQAAVQRKLELALSFEIGALQSDEAVFLYEVDTTALTAPGVDAIKQALAGDLGALTGDTLPAGIRLVRSIFTSMRQRTTTLHINLLGIYNAISISKLVISGTALFEPATGSLVITDAATANRVRASAIEFGADSDKLRHVLAESFLITAVYRGSRMALPAPSLKTSHSFFELHAATNDRQMTADIDVGSALGLFANGETLLPNGIEDFGPTTVYAQLQYDDVLTTSLFLGPGGTPRPLEEYERAGRAAIQLLVREGADDSFRRRPAIDDDLWAKMKSAGQAQFRFMFPAEQAGAITADYGVIVWWSQALRSAAETLAAIHAFLRTHVSPSPDDAEFQQLRGRLAKGLAEVAADTKEEFGRPWGLVAMDLATARQADGSIAITGPRLALSTERAKAVAAP